MYLPALEPITVELVQALPYVGSDLDEADAARLDGIVVSVNTLLRSLPVSDQVRADTQDEADLREWPATIVEGGLMLAGRLWRRRDTPGGVAVMGDAGPVYVRRNDPDVALLLGLGEHGKPAVG